MHYINEGLQKDIISNLCECVWSILRERQKAKPHLAALLYVVNVNEWRPVFQYIQKTWKDQKWPGEASRNRNSKACVAALRALTD